MYHNKFKSKHLHINHEYNSWFKHGQKQLPKLKNEIFFLPISNIKLFGNKTIGITSVRVNNLLHAIKIHPQRAMMGISMIIPLIINTNGLMLTIRIPKHNYFYQDD